MKRKIARRLNGTVLNFAPEGRLDTLAAPELEKNGNAARMASANGRWEKWENGISDHGKATRKRIVSRLIERVNVRNGYKARIQFKISLKQFLGQEKS